MTTSKRNISCALLLGAMLFGVSSTHAAGVEITRGSIIASTCFTCHGTDGKALGSMPAINGMQPERLARMMQEFRAGNRAATVMNRHASGYTDEEIMEVAEYLGKLK